MSYILDSHSSRRPFECTRNVCVARETNERQVLARCKCTRLKLYRTAVCIMCMNECVQYRSGFGLIEQEICANARLSFLRVCVSRCRCAMRFDCLCLYFLFVFNKNADSREHFVSVGPLGRCE